MSIRRANRVTSSFGSKASQVTGQDVAELGTKRPNDQRLMAAAQSGRSLEHPETSAFATGAVLSILKRTTAGGRAQTESTPLTLS
jgi:hypothetical protein